MFDTVPETAPILPENLLKYAQAIQSRYSASKDSTLLAAANMLKGEDEDERRFHELFDALKDTWGADRNSAVVAASIIAFLPTDKGITALAEQLHVEYNGQYTKGGCLIVAARIFEEHAELEALAAEGLIDARGAPTEPVPVAEPATPLRRETTLGRKPVPVAEPVADTPPVIAPLRDGNVLPSQG